MFIKKDSEEELICHLNIDVYSCAIFWNKLTKQAFGHINARKIFSGTIPSLEYAIDRITEVIAENPELIDRKIHAETKKMGLDKKHCFACMKQNLCDQRCSQCGWWICSCGACGCKYPWT